MTVNSTKLPMHLELSQIFDFAQEDMVANRNGYLTVAQINKIRVLPYLAYPGIEYMILPIIYELLFVYGFRHGWYTKEVFHYFDPSIGALVIMLVEAGILFYFRARRKVHFDPTMKVVQMVEGKPHVTSYTLQIGSKNFQLSAGQQMEMKAFVRDANPDANYRAYFVKIHRKMQPILVFLEILNKKAQSPAGQSGL